MRQTGGRSRLEVIHGRAAIRVALAECSPIPMPMGRDGMLVWRAADHLAIRTDRSPEHGRMLLAARFGTTGRDPFLLLDDLAVPANAGPARPRTGGGEQGCRHLLAALLLRLVALEDLPAALVTHADNAALTRALHSLAGAIPAAVRYPNPDSTVIPLRSAAMTHRIARAIGVPAWLDRAPYAPAGPNLVTLDLRSTHEDDLTPALNRLFRARLPGSGSAETRSRSARSRSARAS